MEGNVDQLARNADIIVVNVMMNLCRVRKSPTQKISSRAVFSTNPPDLTPSSSQPIQPDLVVKPTHPIWYQPTQCGLVENTAVEPEHAEIEEFAMSGAPDEHAESMVKVSPDEDTNERDLGICEAVWAANVDGVIVGNTTNRRPEPLPQCFRLPPKEGQLLLQQGRYSGPRLFERTIALLKRYRKLLDERPRPRQEISPEPPTESSPSSSSADGKIERVKATGNEAMDKIKSTITPSEPTPEPSKFEVMDRVHSRIERDARTRNYALQKPKPNPRTSPFSASQTTTSSSRGADHNLLSWHHCISTNYLQPRLEDY